MKEGSSSGADDCLKLLRGERDEQRLAGLLVVTKFCIEDDHTAILKVYDAVGPQFLHRHLRTGSHMIELAMRLVQIIVIKLPSERVYSEHPTDLSMVVAAVEKQFALLQNALKFEALHLLSAILSNGYSAHVYDALRLMENDVWSTNMRIGIVAILQNGVAPSHKLQALFLAECVISIVGEGWLIGEINLTDSEDSLLLTGVFCLFWSHQGLKLLFF